MKRETSNEEKGRESERESSGDGGSRGGGRPGASLQRALGNQAVQELHERGELRAKLEVSHPDDPGEREAERVADRVLDAEREGGRVVNPTRDVGRSGGEGAGSVSGDRERRVRSALSGGRRLPDGTRSYFESRFGRDFSNVRVHTGGAADEAARSIDAEAFTLGSDVAFASGNYRPDTREGKRLIAHELTHVVQGGEAIGRQGPANQMIPGPGGEEETFDVSFPNVQEMSTWEKASFLAQVTSQGGPMMGPVMAGTLLNLYTMSQVFGYTAAVGVGGAASFAGGGGGSAGIVFFPSGQIGVYGTAVGEVGAVVGAGGEVEYTIVFGGRDEFTGDVVGWNAGISAGPSAHGTILMSPDTGEVVGISVDAGIGVGETILEFSASYEGTAVYTGEE